MKRGEGFNLTSKQLEFFGIKLSEIGAKDYILRLKINTQREMVAGMDWLKEYFPDDYKKNQEQLVQLEKELAEVEPSVPEEERNALIEKYPLKTFESYTTEDFERDFPKNK